MRFTSLFSYLAITLTSATLAVSAPLKVRSINGFDLYPRTLQVRDINEHHVVYLVRRSEPPGKLPRPDGPRGARDPGQPWPVTTRRGATAGGSDPSHPGGQPRPGGPGGARQPQPPPEPVELQSQMPRPDDTAGGSDPSHPGKPSLPPIVIPDRRWARHIDPNEFQPPVSRGPSPPGAVPPDTNQNIPAAPPVIVLTKPPGHHASVPGSPNSLTPLSPGSRLKSSPGGSSLRRLSPGEGSRPPSSQGSRLSPPTSHLSLPNEPNEPHPGQHRPSSLGSTHPQTQPPSAAGPSVTGSESPGASGPRSRFSVSPAEEPGGFFRKLKNKFGKGKGKKGKD